MQNKREQLQALLRRGVFMVYVLNHGRRFIGLTITNPQTERLIINYSKSHNYPGPFFVDRWQTA